MRLVVVLHSEPLKMSSGIAINRKKATSSVPKILATQRMNFTVLLGEDIPFKICPSGIEVRL